MVDEGLLMRQENPWSTMAYSGITIAYDLTQRGWDRFEVLEKPRYEAIY